MIRICPKCKRLYSEEPAISRIDNETEICPTCGTREALNDFIESMKGMNVCEDC